VPNALALLRSSSFIACIMLVIASFCVAQNTTYVPSSPDNMLTPANPIGVPPNASSAGTNETINLSSGSAGGTALNSEAILGGPSLRVWFMQGWGCPSLASCFCC
jgi:hypothetical protein